MLGKHEVRGDDKMVTVFYTPNGAKWSVSTQCPFEWAGWIGKIVKGSY
jgi:hypothetical protein